MTQYTESQCDAAKKLLDSGVIRPEGDYLVYAPKEPPTVLRVYYTDEPVEALEKHKKMLIEIGVPADLAEKIYIALDDSKNPKDYLVIPHESLEKLEEISRSHGTPEHIPTSGMRIIASINVANHPYNNPKPPSRS